MKSHTGHQSDSAVQIYIDSTDTQRMQNSSKLAFNSDETSTSNLQTKTDETQNSAGGLDASIVHDLCSNYERGTISKEKYLRMLKIYLDE
jgi:hypothetical protein